MGTIFDDACAMRTFIAQNGGNLRGYMLAHAANYPREQIARIYKADRRQLRKLENEQAAVERFRASRIH